MTPFDQLSDNARVWIYQSTKDFNAEEATKIKAKITEFVDCWVSHGDKVHAFGDLFYQKFVVFVADETHTQVSGCSIDSSIHFIQALQQEFGTDFFSRLNIAYKKADNEVVSADQLDFQTLIDNGTVTPDTIVFNNLVQTKTDFQNKWEVPLKDSWHAKFFKVAVV